MFAQGDGSSRESLDDGPEKSVKNMHIELNSTHANFATRNRQKH